MEIKYELNKDDYIEFNLNYVENSKAMKKNVFIQRYLVSIIFLLVPFALKKSTDIPFSYWMTVFIIAYTLWVVFYPKYFNKTVKKNVEKMLGEGNSNSLYGEHKLSLTEDGITETNEAEKLEIGWNSIEKIVKTEEHIFIYLDSIKAYIVPKRAFKDNKEEEEFITYLENHRI